MASAMLLLPLPFGPTAVTPLSKTNSVCEANDLYPCSSRRFKPHQFFLAGCIWYTFVSYLSLLSFANLIARLAT